MRLVINDTWTNERDPQHHYRPLTLLVGRGDIFGLGCSAGPEQSGPDPSGTGSGPISYRYSTRNSDASIGGGSTGIPVILVNSFR